ncbi:MAG: anthranilate synthase component II [Parvularcula sp.]
MILFIDNYDSFTWNLVHLVGRQNATFQVVRNDSLTVNEALAMGPSGVILSPGPGVPQSAGICMDLVTACKERNIPLLGICLGHQAIVAAAGGTIGQAGRQMHGRTSLVRHLDDALFNDIPSPFEVTRYHSLVAKEASLPDDVRALAYAEDDGEIMAARWGDGPCWGVQFHPESIASTFGDVLVRNFLTAISEGKRAA